MPPHKPFATTLKAETVALISKIQANSDFDPSVPQVVDAAVRDYAKKLGVEA